MIRKFDLELQEDIKSGRERQVRMNKRDKIDIDAIVKSVRHSWQWNDELEGWKERRNLQKERYPCPCTARCYLVCVFASQPVYACPTDPSSTVERPRNYPCPCWPMLSLGLLFCSRFAKNLAWRAYGFYLMYAVISFTVVLLIVQFISPKHPAPTDWPDWTIQFVLGQLESLGTLELDAL